MMSKFVGVFRELASFNELLHTQVELILVERLHRNWLKVSHGIKLHACMYGTHARERSVKRPPVDGSQCCSTTTCCSCCIASTD